MLINKFVKLSIFILAQSSIIFGNNFWTIMIFIKIYSFRFITFRCLLAELSTRSTIFWERRCHKKSGNERKQRALFANREARQESLDLLSSLFCHGYLTCMCGFCTHFRNAYFKHTCSPSGCPSGCLTFAFLLFELFLLDLSFILQKCFIFTIKVSKIPRRILVTVN